MGKEYRMDVTVEAEAEKAKVLPCSRRNGGSGHLHWSRNTRELFKSTRRYFSMNSKSMKLYGKKAVQFARNNKGMFLQLGMMAVVAGLMPDSVAFAQSGASDDTISVLTQPLSRMESLMSGPVPKATREE